MGVEIICRSQSELGELFRKSTFAKGKVEWEDLEIDKEDDRSFISVPQGSYLGDTLICLGDTYEHSGEDCLFIQELIKLYKSGKLILHD